ncbi:MAG: transketolase C-terminal domain-containing protein [Acidimicrobiales bacterium]
MPDLPVIRPADANECAGRGPSPSATTDRWRSCLARQNLPVLEGTADHAGLLRGAYVLVDVPDPDVVLIGTGSEVAVCVDAATQLAAGGIAARVVSMPCWELFEAQDASYRAEVLPQGVPVLSVEAATTFGWARWADASVGIDRFGASAPGAEVLRQLGIEPGHVADEARRLVG